MKLLLYFILSFPYCLSVKAQSPVNSDSTLNYLDSQFLKRSVYQNRILVKHHFLCACMNSDSKTLSNYFLLISNSYSMIGINKIFDYETRFNNSLKSNSNFFPCITHYESKELDLFVRSLDTYLIIPNH